MVDQHTILGGRYRLLDIIGDGGMARVYRAYDARLDRQVAVKVLHRDLLGRPDIVRRFEQEARLTSVLQHPHIVAIYDVGHDAELRYMVMEYVEGGSLKRLIDRDAPLAAATLISVVEQLGQALDAAHAHGVIHRDVKPENILLTPDGQVKVSDFGIAHALSNDSATTTGMVFGSVAYLAPEQALGRPITAETDIYGSGIVLYQMLTGRLPFEAATPLATALQQISEPPPLPRALVPTLPPTVDNVVLTALAKEPTARYPSGAALAAALTTALEGQRVLVPSRGIAVASGNVVVRPTSAVGARPSILTPLLSRRARAAAVPLALALLGGAAAVSLLRGAHEPSASQAPRVALGAPTAAPTAAPTSLVTAGLGRRLPSPSSTASVDRIRGARILYDAPTPPPDGHTVPGSVSGPPRRLTRRGAAAAAAETHAAASIAGLSRSVYATVLATRHVYARPTAHQGHTRTTAPTSGALSGTPPRGLLWGGASGRPMRPRRLVATLTPTATGTALAGTTTGLLSPGATPASPTVVAPPPTTASPRTPALAPTVETTPAPLATTPSSGGAGAGTAATLPALPRKRQPAFVAPRRRPGSGHVPTARPSRQQVIHATPTAVASPRAGRASSVRPAGYPTATATVVARRGVPTRAHAPAATAAPRYAKPTAIALSPAATVAPRSPLVTVTPHTPPTPTIVPTATRAALVRIAPTVTYVRPERPTATPLPRATATRISLAPVAPTATPHPTMTPLPRPTSTPLPRPTSTPLPRPTSTPLPRPTSTPLPRPTSTPHPTMTPTPPSTATHIPPTATIAPTVTRVPPTATTVPTVTPAPPTATSVPPTPTVTPIPPTDTPIPPMPTDVPTDTAVPGDGNGDGSGPTKVPKPTKVPRGGDQATPPPGPGDGNGGNQGQNQASPMREQSGVGD